MPQRAVVLLRGHHLRPVCVSDTFWVNGALIGSRGRWEAAAALARLAYVRRAPQEVYVADGPIPGRVVAMPEYRASRLWGVALLFEPDEALGPPAANRSASATAVPGAARPRGH